MKHKLPQGKQLISALSELGGVLNYYVEPEFPVDRLQRGTAPAVDLAWFKEKRQRFPLIIFEVESIASNTIANNPLKVFAQENRRFEKPLFFFHLVARGTSKSSRIANLERQYGSHNYRVYNIENGDGTKLVCDILSQHRRINSRADYVSLYEVLAGTNWGRIVDPAFILREAYKLGLSKKSRLSAYIRIARSYPAMLDELLKVVQEERLLGWKSVGNLEAYVGHTWGVFPLCALMSRYSSKRDASSWADSLLHFQNKNSFMPMISPAFGLSRDYDEFLLGVAAPLVGLCVAVAGERATFCKDMCEVLADILKRLRPGWTGFQTAIWLSHIAARFNLPSYFESGRKFINAVGGVKRTQLYGPPSCISVADADRQEQFPPGGERHCPDLTQFRRNAFAMYRGTQSNPFQLVLSAIDDESFMYKWAKPILSELWNQE